MATPIGRLTKKIHCQPSHSVSTPPSSGTDRDGARRPSRSRAAIARSRARALELLCRSARATSRTWRRRRPPGGPRARSRSSCSATARTASEATVNSDNAAGEDALAPDPVGERPAGQDQRGERQRVGVDHPLQAREARVQVSLDARQRDLHDRHIHEQHERASADRDQRPPAPGQASLALGAHRITLASAPPRPRRRRRCRRARLDCANPGRDRVSG